MKKFNLSPNFCMYNSIAIVEQKGLSITFIVEHFDDDELKNRVRKAFSHYAVSAFGTEKYGNAHEPLVTFVRGDYNEVRSHISKLYSAHENEIAVQNLKNHADISTRINGYINSDVRTDGVTRTEDSAAEILLDTIISDARQKNATDVHIENCTVRFRISGKLTTVMHLQDERSRELVQRIKLLAHLNVLEKRKSQDGQFVYGDDNYMFVRVSCVGAIGDSDDGLVESVVLRLLDPLRVPLSIDTLGLNENQCEAIRRLCGKKNGLVLICGPTGAGKSTTAAAMLLEIQKTNNGEKKIISIEDPPEYVMEGVTQIKVDDDAGDNFSNVLAKVFRQDPDVIFIGEIRDDKSAFTAIQASLTGHLVFATLHTGDAPSSVMRMQDLGTDRAVLISVLRGVISQELSYANGEAELVADVAVVRDDMKNAAINGATSDEIDSGFTHCSNVMTHVLHSLQRKQKSAWTRPITLTEGKVAEEVFA